MLAKISRVAGRTAWIKSVVIRFQSAFIRARLGDARAMLEPTRIQLVSKRWLVDVDGHVVTACQGLDNRSSQNSEVAALGFHS